MPIADELIRTELRLGAHNYKPLDVMLARGEGVWLWDTEGKRYLDCLSAYSAVNQGHCHPRILAAMAELAFRSGGTGAWRRGGGATRTGASACSGTRQPVDRREHRTERRAKGRRE